VNWRAYLKLGSDGWSSTYISVDKLLKHLSRKSRSELSRDVYCQRLSSFCQRIGKKPDEFVRMDKQTLEERIQESADEKRESPKYANNRIDVLKAFFKVNGREDLKFPHYYVPPRHFRRGEYIPTLEEAWKMAECAGSMRNRAMIHVFISTGLRNSAPRALKYGTGDPHPMFKDYTIKNELMRSEKNIMIVVHEGMNKDVPGACKNRIPYYVFLSANATEALADYLKERERKQRGIADDEFVFCTENRWIPMIKRRFKPVSRRELQVLVKGAARKADITGWMHVTPKSLRKTFDGALRNQPSDVRLDNKDQEFLMGHILPGSQDAYYDRTKIKEMREKFSRLIFRPSRDQGWMPYLSEMAEIWGVDFKAILTEARKRAGKDPSRGDIKEALKERIGLKWAIKEVKKEQIIVSEEELEKYLRDGWEYEKPLPSGRIVISKTKKMKSKGSSP